MMLAKHIQNNDKIFIQVDSDCDGYTSAAVLINYLNRLFPYFVDNNITYRLHDSKAHGIIDGTIPPDVRLVIAPDASSNDYEIHGKLKAQGIDVLVIDHHEAEAVSPFACVINNQLCDYPTKSLSGVGMVYKFCCYLDELLGVSIADDFLDLVSLGLIADMMNTQDLETQHLIQKGLLNIINPFFKGMIEKQAFSLKNENTPMGIAFYVAPLINAVTRVGTQDEKSVLFKSMLEPEANKLIPSTKRGCKGQYEECVTQAVRMCTNVKSRQTRLKESGVEMIDELIQSRNLLENKILVVKLDTFSIDTNLTGLIANDLMSRYHRPTLVLNRKFDDKGVLTWAGSGRGYDKTSFNNFRGFLEDSGLVEYAQGHAQAFGVSVTNANFKALIDYANEQLKDYDFSPAYQVDFIYQASELVPKDVLDVSALYKVWGQGVSEAYVAVEGVSISANNIQLIGLSNNRPTLKISLPCGIELMKFKASEEEFNNLKTEGCIKINLVGKCDKNEWGGSITPQILVEDYEIVSRLDYYF